MRYINYINTWLRENESSDLFNTSLEKSLFVSLAESCCGLIGGNDSVSGNVSGYDVDINYYGVIGDVYQSVFAQIVKPILDNNNKLMGELEKQILYGTRITLTTDEFKNVADDFFKKEEKENKP